MVAVDGSCSRRRARAGPHGRHDGAASGVSRGVRWRLRESIWWTGNGVGWPNGARRCRGRAAVVVAHQHPVGCIVTRRRMPSIAGSNPHWNPTPRPTNWQVSEVMRSRQLGHPRLLSGWSGARTPRLSAMHYSPGALQGAGALSSTNAPRSWFSVAPNRSRCNVDDRCLALGFGLHGPSFITFIATSSGSDSRVSRQLASWTAGSIIVGLADIHDDLDGFRTFDTDSKAPPRDDPRTRTATEHTGEARSSSSAVLGGRAWRKQVDRPASYAPGSQCRVDGVSAEMTIRRSGSFSKKVQDPRENRGKGASSCVTNSS
jgi:hypothetical protein